MPGDVLGVEDSKVPLSPCTCPLSPTPAPPPLPSGGQCALEAPSVSSSEAALSECQDQVLVCSTRSPSLSPSD